MRSMSLMTSTLKVPPTSLAPPPNSAITPHLQSGSLCKVSMDKKLLRLCVMVFLSFLPKAGQYFLILGKSLCKVSMDKKLLRLCVMMFLSYLPEAGQYPCFFGRRTLLKQANQLLFDSSFFG
ncbi:uncharacterized protein [Dysidea avara]|uniref:uncharacterized protein n=1 Tax=Dysidea avara TaxID=196820 RepID=UPI003325FD6C